MPKLTVTSAEPAPAPAAVRPPEDGDALLDIEGVRKLLPLQNGRPFSRKFVLRRVAPESKVRFGRGIYWRKRDVEQWLRDQTTPRTPPGGRARAS